MNLLRRRKPTTLATCPTCGRTEDELGRPLRIKRITNNLAEYVSGRADSLVIGEGFCSTCGCHATPNATKPQIEEGNLTDEELNA